MTVSKPSKFPQWSTNTDGTDHNVTNVDSGTNNAIEPSSGKKLLGWDYKEAPAYSSMNWLHRLYDQWIRWFDANNLLVSRNTGALSLNLRCTSTPIQIVWEKRDNPDGTSPSIITLGFLNYTAIADGTSMYTTTDLPADLRPVNTVYIPYIFLLGSVQQNGYVLIDAGGSIAFYTNSNSNATSAGNGITFPPATVSYTKG